MQLESTSTVEAVVLFAGNRIIREMLYPEFEAILDGFVPVPDFKSSAAKACYLVIDSELNLVAVAFFLLDFDAKGMADRRWNIPLQHLTEVSGKGPDLGSGPIRLACFSQCAIEWQQKKLWDPHMGPNENTFQILQKAVRVNHLGLVFKAPIKEKNDVSVEPIFNQKNQLAMQQKLHEHYAQELHDRLAASLKEQHLRIATIESTHQEYVKKLQYEHQQRLQVYKQRLQSLEAKNAELTIGSLTFKEKFEIQVNKVEGIREYFLHKLRAAQVDETSHIQAIEENFALELELKIQAATAELRESLDMREIELFYRNQSEENLKEEIENLKNEYQSLLNNSGEQVLIRLGKAGVNFVVYHPGAGQFNLELEDLSNYLENPTTLVAKKAGVDESLYTHWLIHYQHPICIWVDAKGSLCGRALSRIGSPLEFHQGESNRCKDHQAISYKHANANDAASKK
jgi:hypothetical protein